jgi:hypothetical protein
MPTVYRKSAKGVSEIETRAHKLPPRLRSALILVDGKRSDAELKAMLAQQADETLATLAGEGFIEVVTVAAEAQVSKKSAAAPVGAGASMYPSTGAGPATLPPVPSTLAMSIPPSELATRKRDAVRAVNDLLGPMGETLSMKIEKARTGEEFRQVLEGALPVIAGARGRDEAAKFAARISDQ